MTYWRATIERPDDAGGWTMVGVFGTKDTPGGGFARHLHGATAMDAAQLLLTHVWPVNLDEFNRRRDGAKWADEQAARTGIADHRITIDVDEDHSWSVPYGEAVPEPATFTVAELRLIDVRTRAAALADAKTNLKELQDRVRQARNSVESGRFNAEQAVEMADLAGVPKADIAAARRQPRTGRPVRRSK